MLIKRDTFNWTRTFDLMVVRNKQEVPYTKVIFVVRQTLTHTIGQFSMNKIRIFSLFIFLQTMLLSTPCSKSEIKQSIFYLKSREGFNKLHEYVIPRAYFIFISSCLCLVQKNYYDLSSRKRQRKVLIFSSSVCRFDLWKDVLRRHAI
jgi:hypothetical protein